MVEAISAGDGSAHFLKAIDPTQARDERPEIDRFVEWLGPDHLMGELTGEQISVYLRERFPDVFAEEERPAELDDEMSTELEPLRAFLAYASRLAFTEENLVPFLLLREGGGGARGGAGAAAELGGGAYYVTLEGLASLETELEELEGAAPRRWPRSCAPRWRTRTSARTLPWTRRATPRPTSRRGSARSRTSFGTPVIIDPETKGGRANVGSTVKVMNLEMDREQTFQLVSPSEVDPSGGKISVESPVGHAVINHVPGDEVTVNAPAGPVRLRVLDVEG